jgi:pilus assembly protein CpaE
VRSIAVAVAHPDPRVADEVVHAVEASPDLYLAVDPAAATVVVAGEALLAAYRDRPPPDAVAIVALAADGELPRVARAALACGACDLVRWPEDGPALRDRVREAAARARLRVAAVEGTVVAVVGARGGVGTTTLAALLARSLPEAAVVDLDAAGAGQADLAPAGADPTLAQVLAAVDDLDPAGLRAALVPHAAGRALLAAPGAPSPTPEQAMRLVALLRAALPLAVVDAGRGQGDAGRALLGAADVVLAVVAGDVTSLRGARALLVDAPALRPVLSRAAPGSLGSRDVARVLGRRPVAVVPRDRAVGRAREAGRLPRRGRAHRAVARLAAALARELADGR